MASQELVAGPSPRSYVLGLLLVVYTFNFIDRQILSILIEPIRMELDLSDSQMGLLAGFAFSLVYTTLGVPIARYSDQGNRRNVIAWAVAIWSAMTALCGIAQSYAHLLVARVGVAIGEAGCAPPSHSLISDYFPASRRATALGIFGLGIPIGIMFGLLAGGWISEIFGWRYAFLLVGIPGLLLAVLVRWTLSEPERGMADGGAADDVQPTVWSTLRYLWSKRSFRHLAAGAALVSFVVYGVLTWVPAFLMRSHGMRMGEIGTYLGLIFGLAGSFGIFGGGYLGDLLGRRHSNWNLWMVAIAQLVAFPFLAGLYLVDDTELALALLFVAVGLGYAFSAPTFGQTQNLALMRMRAVAASIMMFVMNIVGLGLGPQVVGSLSDALRDVHGVESLRWSLFVCAFVLPWAAWHYYLAGKYLKADLADVVCAQQVGANGAARGSTQSRDAAVHGGPHR